ncbi:PREDICTED: glutathione S-transferase F8, chloroplastic-like [Tarenaya hassleriana]|uniref:glutathione S-transferase F8, chloroplastic-like n=1 Tax=Tarenaya hassleriana TaxID=28532 RepID=UPI00053C9D83|nr:PREDICTED: glutathione S-transferase F8, chloroplastic-like [Tarenaya hassleriana]
MAAIKLYGVPLSTATMRALAALYEKGLEFELVPVDTSSGAHKQEPHISRNPFGQVPAFDDGDVKLFESRAITQYIAEEYNDKGNRLFCPGNKVVKAATRPWVFEPVAMKLTFERFYKPMFGMSTDPAAAEELEGKLGKVLDVYEKRLGESEYLACNCFTLADLHHLPAVHCLMATDSKKVFQARPKVSEWVAKITAREAWAKVLALQKPH